MNLTKKCDICGTCYAFKNTPFKAGSSNKKSTIHSEIEKAYMAFVALRDQHSFIPDELDIDDIIGRLGQMLDENNFVG